jgi:nucleotide-binding universal stress UspA family protein
MESALSKRHRQSFKQREVDTNTFLVHGLPADEIVKKAETERYDMIVIGSRGRTAAKSFLLGSVSNRVSHQAKCPVLIVK